MKKVIIALVLSLLTVTMLVLPCMAATTSVTLAVEASASAAKAGETVSINVSIKEITTPYNLVQGVVTYDGKALQYVDCERSTVSGATISVVSETNQLYVTISGGLNGSFDYTGVLAKLNFKVKDFDATTVVSVICKNATTDLANMYQVFAEKLGGQTEITGIGSAHVHTYDKQIVKDEYKATEATCTKKATYYLSCICGEKGEATFETGELSTVHVFDKQVVTEAYLASAATCTKKASYFYSCECGLKGENTFESGDMLSHTYDKQVATDAYLASAATCTKKATYYFSCVCGAKGTETFENGELAAHKTELKNAAAASCTAEGYTGDSVCSVCGSILEAGKVIAKADHNYVDGKCAVCGASDPNFVAPATGDTLYIWVSVAVASLAVIAAFGVIVILKKRENRE